MRKVPPVGLFVAMAAVIAALAFAIGQAQPGAGVPVVIALATGWAVFAHRRWGAGARG